MKKDVTVTSDEAGNVIVLAENPMYGHVIVIQQRTIVDENGWAKPKNVTALIHGTVADLKEIGYHKDQILPGMIIIKESLSPFNKKDSTKDIKVAGKSKVVCSIDGNPIYRKTFYDQTGRGEDVILQHTNVEQIRMAYAEEMAMQNTSSALDQ